MNPLAVIFLAVTSILLLKLPRKWALAPLLAGACYMTLGQGVDIAGFNFTLIRLLLLVGIVRVLISGERPVGFMTGMDRMILIWAVWALLSSAFHQSPMETLSFHLGMVYNVLGIYFLGRCFCADSEDVRRVILMLALVLVPVALEMVFEQITRKNAFALLGGVDEDVVIRNGRPRSQGPFAHAILAGTVGAVSAPLMFGIWRSHLKIALLGLTASLVMVVASASSGPLMSLVLSIVALSFWRLRHLTRAIRIGAILIYVALELVMNAPAYYLIARIDLTGGSTGYHRAALMEAAIKHLNEWWWAGSDHTRHWMPYGVGWSENHVDITNHYLAQGVRGGLPLMIMFTGLIVCGFRYAGKMGQFQSLDRGVPSFFVWTLGASLFAHATTCISVAYFDQSVIFVYLTLAMLSSLRGEHIANAQNYGIENDSQVESDAYESKAPYRFS